MILIIREPATREQLAHMSEASGGTLVKLAVDVERRVLAGGGELHADCEAAEVQNPDLRSRIETIVRQYLEVG